MRGRRRTSGERGGAEILVWHPQRCYRGLRERNRNSVRVIVRRRHPRRCNCVLPKRKSRDPYGHDHRVGCNDCSRFGYRAAKQFSDFTKSVQNRNTKGQGVGGVKRTLRS